MCDVVKFCTPQQLFLMEPQRARRAQRGRIYFCLFSAVSAISVFAIVLAAQNPPAKQSVWDGVYTDAQALRGERTYGRCLAGLPRRFYGGIETDKVGLLGLGYLLFYELTGDRPYLRWVTPRVGWFMTLLSRQMHRDPHGLLRQERFSSGQRVEWRRR